MGTRHSKFWRLHYVLLSEFHLTLFSVPCEITCSDNLADLIKPYDPSLALAMYCKMNHREKFLQCSLDPNIAISAILQNLVDMDKSDIWAEMFSSEIRGQLVQEALAKAANTEYFSQITKAFLDANMINELLEMIKCVTARNEKPDSLEDCM